MKYVGENYDKVKESHITLSPKLTPSEKNWNTKEDKNKSMICVLYVLQLVKRHISGQNNIK